MGAVQAYSFEGNWIQAAKTVLTMAGVQTLAFNDADVEDVEDGEKELPRIEIGFSISQVDVDGGEADIPGATGRFSTYLMTYSATLLVDVMSKTGDSEHFERVGIVRTLMTRHEQQFDSNRLPYYQVIEMHETSGSSGLSNAEDDEIMTSLSFSVKFQILPSALEETES